MSRISVTAGSLIMAPHPWHCFTVTRDCWARGPGSRRLHLASVIPGTASHLHHCGPGHHPPILRVTSISHASGLPLAARALYMVGFHSFVCTFGEGLLCARPCARHQVNGHCPWECTRRGHVREPADDREPGPRQPGDAGQRRVNVTWGAGWGGKGMGAEGSAKVLLSGVWKERAHGSLSSLLVADISENGTGNPGACHLSKGSPLLGPSRASALDTPFSGSAPWPCPLLEITQFYLQPLLVTSFPFQRGQWPLP